MYMHRQIDFKFDHHNRDIYVYDQHIQNVLYNAQFIYTTRL